MQYPDLRTYCMEPFLTYELYVPAHNRNLPKKSPVLEVLHPPEHLRRTAKCLSPVAILVHIRTYPVSLFIRSTYYPVYMTLYIYISLYKPLN